MKLKGSFTSIILLFVLVLAHQSQAQGWERIHGGSMDDAAYSIEKATDGGYLLAGWTNSFNASNKDFYLFRLLYKAKAPKPNNPTVAGSGTGVGFAQK